MHILLTKRRRITIVFLASAACTASPALAMEAKQCMSMDQMNTELRAEGQRTLIIGDRIAAVGKSNEPGVTRMIRNVNTVTSNPDGSLGYQLEGDKSRAEISTSVCIRAKLTDIRLFDARKSDIPQEAYLGGDFNRTVDEVAAAGNRPMLIANTLHGTGSSVHKGLPLIVFGNIAEQAGTIATRTTDGKSALLALMSKTEYTEEAIRRLDQMSVMSPRR